MNKALILGCNYYIGLSIARCLGREDVHVVACDYDFGSYASKTKYIKEKLHIKELNKFNEVALEKLIEYGKKQDSKPILFPSHDKYVSFIDKYYEKLSVYFHISQARGSLNTKLMDKLELSKIAMDNNIQIPLTVDLASPDFHDKISDMQFPCILKPVDTVEFTEVFHSKVKKCNSLEELELNYAECKKHNLEVFAQQIIPGFDDHMLTYDFYIDSSGKTTHYMTAQKQRQWPINFGASVFIAQKFNRKLVDIGLPFTENIGYRGFGEIEFKEHEETGEIYLIEINARTTNFNNMIYKLGINMPYLVFCDLIGIDKKENLYIDYDTNYAFIYGYEDLAAILKYSKTNQVSIFASIGKTLSKRLAPAIFSIFDLKPWLAFNFGVLKRKLFGKK